jgi:hypothetical protein
MEIASYHADTSQGYLYGPQTHQYGYIDNEKSQGQSLQSELALEMEFESSSDESDNSDNDDLSPEIDFPQTADNPTYYTSRSQSINLLPKRIKSVTWAGSVVTDVFYRPKVTMKEKRELFYDSSEMQRYVVRRTHSSKW